MANKLFSEIELKRPGTNVFLDSNCLPHALDWRQSFEIGLKQSKVIILLVSLDELKTGWNLLIFHHMSEFSWDKIRANAPNSSDNVLLEMELALIRLKSEPEGTVAIFPVFVGTNPKVYLHPFSPLFFLFDHHRQVNGKDTEVYVKCPLPLASSFPNVPHDRGFPLHGYV